MMAKEIILLDKPKRTITGEAIDVESDYSYLSESQVVDTPKERGTT